MLVIFDFDGTLVNSLPDIAVGANYALQKNGFPVYSLDRYAAFVGSGLNKLFERALPEGCKTPEWIRKVRMDYDDYYREHSLDQTKPYEGIVPMLADLKEAGIRLAVLSNKDHAFALPMVNAIFPDTFDYAFGHRDGYNTKPDPRSALEIIEAAGAAKEKAVMVGDTGIDMRMAKNAQIYAVGVTWGFRGEAELMQTGADRIVHDRTELKKILLEYLTR